MNPFNQLQAAKVHNLKVWRDYGGKSWQGVRDNMYFEKLLTMGVIIIFTVIGLCLPYHFFFARWFLTTVSVLIALIYNIFNESDMKVACFFNISVLSYVLFFTASIVQFIGYSALLFCAGVLYGLFEARDGVFLDIIASAREFLGFIHEAFSQIAYEKDSSHIDCVKLATFLFSIGMVCSGLLGLALSMNAVLHVLAIVPMIPQLLSVYYYLSAVIGVLAAASTAVVVNAKITLFKIEDRKVVLHPVSFPLNAKEIDQPGKWFDPSIGFEVKRSRRDESKYFVNCFEVDVPIVA